MKVSRPLHKQLTRSLLAICLVCLLNACTYYACYLETGAEIYPPTDPDNIQLFVAEPTRAYRVLGAVAADGIRQEEAVRHLKKRVTEIGADAIIKLKLDKASSFSSRISVSGVAVKFVE